MKSCFDDREEERALKSYYYLQSLAGTLRSAEGTLKEIGSQKKLEKKKGNLILCQNQPLQPVKSNLKNMKNNLETLSPRTVSSMVTTQSKSTLSDRMEIDRVRKIKDIRPSSYRSSTVNKETKKK